MSGKKENHLHLELNVDSIPYIVDAEVCVFNDELQYRVTVDDNDEVLFVFDTELGRYFAAGNDGSLFPENVEEAIAAELNRDSLSRKKAV